MDDYMITLNPGGILCATKDGRILGIGLASVDDAFELIEAELGRTLTIDEVEAIARKS